MRYAPRRRQRPSNLLPRYRQPGERSQRMSQPEMPDVHAPYMQELADAGDWAGLVRYWMAHQHLEALEKAIILVQNRAAEKGSGWRRLVALLAGGHQRRWRR